MHPSREDQLLFAKHFERAQGWLLLEKYDEAAKALRKIPVVFRDRPEVVLIRAALAMAAKA